MRPQPKGRGGSPGAWPRRGLALGAFLTVGLLLASIPLAASSPAARSHRKSSLTKQVERFKKRFPAKTKHQRKARQRCIRKAREAHAHPKGKGKEPGESTSPPVTEATPPPESGGGQPSPPPGEPPTIPDTIIDSAPAGPLAQREATASFHSDPSGATFQCSLNSGAWTSCSSPKTYSSLADGSYEFAVRALAGEGVDPTPATASFEVEATPPQTTITSAPSGRTPSGPVSFEFSADEPGSTFQCSLDGAAFAACASPYELPSPAPGPHGLKV